MARVRAAFDRIGPDGARVDALVVTTPANVRWLTGFSGSAGLLLVTAAQALLVTDGRYRTQAEEQLASAGVDGEVECFIGGVQAQRDALADAAPAGTIGLESDTVTWSALRSWTSVLEQAELVPTSGVVEDLRVVKDAGEVARMERAAAIADAALAEVVEMLSAGIPEHATGDRHRYPTELEVATALDHAMRRHGSEDRAFATIVASGENAAGPHARPGPRRMERGDPVVIDFGAVFDGYRSDMTRTFCLGGAPAGLLAELFSVVADAQTLGVRAVRAGVASGSVDAAAREPIVAAGWGDRFEHGTGHGVGLDIHERPWVGAGSTAILSPGAVVTVEPGIYLPGTGGVRIEDTLVVTDDGCRPLTLFPKEVAL
ncbi:MAG: M24 family metallopeptidase [Acidimicrobiales bacterium]